MKPPPLPQKLFEPQHLVLPLEPWPSSDSPALAAFITERLGLGDPGPLHIENGMFYTPMSLEEEEGR